MKNRNLLLVVAIPAVLLCGGSILLAAAGAGWWYYGRLGATDTPEAVAPATPAEPEVPRWRTELDAGIAALDAGDAAGALPHLDAALAEVPDNAEALTVRARAHTRLGQEDRAAADYAALLVLRPDDPDALYGHAWCLHRLERDDAALADLDRLTTLAPQRGDGWALRGECLWQLGKLDLAEQSAAHACELGHTAGCTLVERYRSTRR